MFTLKNKTGNAYRHAESEAKRDRLVAAGWVDVTEEQGVENAAPEKKKPKQTRRRNNGNGRNQTADEGKTAPEQDADEGKTAPEQDADEGKTAPEQDADEGKTAPEQDADEGKTAPEQDADKATEDDQETEADEE